MDKYFKISASFMKSQANCCLSSITKNGFPLTRAMLIPIKQEDSSFWFHTNTSSNKVQQLKENPKASIYFYNCHHYEGLLFLGYVDVIEKESEKRPFWKEEYRIYYTKGEGISDFCILKFTAINGEYYRNMNVECF